MRTLAAGISYLDLKFLDTPHVIATGVISYVAAALVICRGIVRDLLNILRKMRNR